MSLFLAGVLAITWFERRSALAVALRQGRPCLGWLALKNGPSERAPALFLAVYQPARRTLDLVHLPGTTRPKGGKSLETVYTAALNSSAKDATQRMAQAAGEYLATLVPAWKDWQGLPVWTGECPVLSDEPPLDARQWILLRAGRPRLWPQLLRAAISGRNQRQPWLDCLLLALELNRLPPQNLRPAWLAPQDQVGPLFARYLSAVRAGPASAKLDTVEVLNATPRPGIASRAKNILRLNGADVMYVGNAGEPRLRTTVYDRTGCFENAALVARMLGCTEAATLTQVDLKRLVDVTVVLAEDCPLP